MVEKKLYFRKNNRNPELAGKLKEVIPQISQSNKWPLRMTVERDGKAVTRNSYSFLQDRYYEHMIAAGFDGFERGERGSAAEHLEVLDYKIKQDEALAKELAAEVEKQKKQAARLDKQITVKEKAKATIKEVEAMGKPAILGGLNLTADDAIKLKTLAKKAVNADKQVSDSKKKVTALDEQITDLHNKLRDAEAEANHWHREYTDLWNEVKGFISAIRKFPSRLLEFVVELFRPEREATTQREQERKAQIQPKQKNHNREVSL